jgi:hypothetical protein
MPPFIEKLVRAYEVDWEFQDSPEALADIARELDPILLQCPRLLREASYLQVLRLTGGLHAHDCRVSFALAGFGVNVTDLRDGDLLEDDRWMRFGDLMLPEYQENIIFAFDLSGTDRAVYAGPASHHKYQRYADDFEDLADRILLLKGV